MTRAAVLRSLRISILLSVHGSDGEPCPLRLQVVCSLYRAGEAASVSRMEVVVIAVIGPGPRARHEALGFLPDGPWQRRELAALYRDSGRRLTYLGDWHSHPRGAPLPSDLDLETAERIAASPRAQAPRPLMVILGRDDRHPWILAAYRFTEGELRPVEARAHNTALAARSLADDLMSMLRADAPAHVSAGQSAR